MGLDIRDDCRYLETHEWARRDDGTATIGISDFAQDELGDIVFVELPSPGEHIEANTEFAVIESIKAVSDLYAPVSGEVLEVNDRLETEPELVNEDPFGEGWMLQVGSVTDDEYQALLSPSEYEDKTA